MARNLVCSMAAVTALFITTSVGFILMSTFTDAAAVLLPNQPPVTLLSRQTERLVTVSADGTVRADGLSDDSDTRLIREAVGPYWRFKSMKYNSYISVTPQGKLRAFNEPRISGSSHFLPTEMIVSGCLRYHKLQTTVVYQSPATATDDNYTDQNTTFTNAQNATCYIAIDTFDGDPPSNVCDVAENEFAFDEDPEYTLLFQIALSLSALGLGR